MADKEAWYESTIKPLKDRYEDRVSNIAIPSVITPGSIKNIVQQIVSIIDEACVDFSKYKTITSAVENEIDSRKAALKSTSTKDKGNEKLEEAKMVLASEGYFALLAEAQAKFNYMMGVVDRLKKKKEMLNIDKTILEMEMRR